MRSFTRLLFNHRVRLSDIASLQYFHTHPGKSPLSGADEAFLATELRNSNPALAVTIHAIIEAERGRYFTFSANAKTAAALLN